MRAIVWHIVIVEIMFDLNVIVEIMFDLKSVRFYLCVCWVQLAQSHASIAVPVDLRLWRPQSLEHSLCVQSQSL